VVVAAPALAPVVLAGAVDAGGLVVVPLEIVAGRVEAEAVPPAVTLVGWMVALPLAVADPDVGTPLAPPLLPQSSCWSWEAACCSWGVQLATQPWAEVKKAGFWQAQVGSVGSQPASVPA